jgi:hypothetical protein
LYLNCSGQIQNIEFSVFRKQCFGILINHLGISNGLIQKPRSEEITQHQEVNQNGLEIPFGIFMSVKNVEHHVLPSVIQVERQVQNNGWQSKTHNGQQSPPTIPSPTQKVGEGKSHIPDAGERGTEVGREAGGPLNRQRQPHPEGPQEP